VAPALHVFLARATYFICKSKESHRSELGYLLIGSRPVAAGSGGAVCRRVGLQECRCASNASSYAASLFWGQSAVRMTLTEAEIRAINLIEVRG
jgi:hypothetical protein